MAEVKALVINSKETLQGGSGKWQEISQIQSLTRSIITPPLSEMADVSAMVSGVPSVFARESLFIHSLTEAEALRNLQKKDEDSGLSSYYLNLIDQWRGLLAFIALNSGKLEVKRITLAYSDGKAIAATSNIYEPKGAFGNMLFEDENLWTDPSDPSKTKQPFIYVIKHNGKVIGGTSPRTLLFSSVSYSIDEDSPCVDVKTKKLTDPIQNNPNKEQLAALFAYIRQLMPKIEKLEKTYEGKIDYKAIKHELTKWEGEIHDKLDEDEREKSSPWPVNLFKSSPFNIFDYSDKLYGCKGVIYSEEREGCIEFDANDLLLPKDSVIARLNVLPEITKDQKDYRELLPVFALRARRTGTKEYAFFALPLSETALKIFSSQNSLEIFLGERNNENIKSSLKAEYNDKTLEVTLNVVTVNNKQKTVNMEYAVGTPMSANDIMIWPNFISPQWNEYYLYSELPHNTTSEKCPFSAMPFTGAADKDLVDITDADGNILYAKNLVAESDSRTSDQPYKYEIYRSDKPFKGVKMENNGRQGGLFVIKYDSAGGNYIPTCYENKHLKEVTIGIDFGSTNTAVAYFDKNQMEASGLKLNNQTVSLFHADTAQTESPMLAKTIEKDLLFFQSTELYSNAIKSILTIQNEQHLPQTEMKDSISRLNYIQEAVKGGMPCFRREIPIKHVEGGKMIAEIPGNSSQITLIQNMKWVDDDEEKAHKTAYLGSLLLHVYANLFELGYVPNQLNWSYPSAMGSVLIRQYGQIWKNLQKITPVLGKTLKVADVPSVSDTVGDKEWNIPQQEQAWGSSNSGWGSSDQTNSWGSSNNSDGWGNSNNTDGWGSSNNSDGWGDSENAGWNGGNSQPNAGQKNSTAKQIDTGEGEAFDFQVIDSTKALTEACAVANYLSHDTKLRQGGNILTLSFDIGGSTTDISAICEYQNKKYMVKQNSIRFAAQRLSFATREMHQPFGNVLRKVCHSNNLRVLGLNSGPDLYNKDTAPYFFEQIVDMLNEEQLRGLYSAVAADCPGLFSVNLYVTGLILFYAGQIVTKLVKEIKRSSQFPEMANWKPLVQVVFTGKGSRIVEWLNSVDEKAAYNYYLDMFCEGIGGKKNAQGMLGDVPRIRVETKPSNVIKFEVSKGLATADKSGTPLQLNNKHLEIIGEEGFTIKDPASGEVKQLAFDDSITADMYRYTSVYFDAPYSIEPMKTRFFAFIKIFYNYASHMFGFAMKQSDIIDGIANMNYISYIRNLPEFRKATESGKDFDFVAPIIIIEGMKFYDEYLLKGVRK